MGRCGGGRDAGAGEGEATHMMRINPLRDVRIIEYSLKGQAQRERVFVPWRFGRTRTMHPEQLVRADKSRKNSLGKKVSLEEVRV